jgi:hypothetical protein
LALRRRRRRCGSIHRTRSIAHRVIARLSVVNIGRLTAQRSANGLDAAP